MVNNVGITTNKTLNSTLGGVTTPALTSADITMKSGELGVGCLVFDSKGTLAVITRYVDDTDFTLTTYAVSIDIETILELSY